MSSLGLATPHALCPRCLLHRGFLLTRTQAPSSSLRCVGDSVGGWLHAQSKDAARSTRRHYHSSPSRLNNKHGQVVTDSLQATLDLHRSMNRQSLIRRVLSEVPRSDTWQPDIPYTPPSPKKKPDTVTKSAYRPQTVKHEKNLDNGLDMVISKVDSGTIGPTVRRVFGDSSEKSKSASRRHPFDRKSTSRKFSGHRRENMCWVVGTGQSPQYPWMEQLSSEQEQWHDGLSQLNAEIKAFEKFITPSSQETEICERVLSETANLIADNLRTSLPVCVGSRSTGMSLTHSDIDIIIPIEDPERPADGGRGPSATRPKAVRSQLGYLRRVDGILKASGDFRHVLSIRARVPIVSAVHGRTGLEMQFQCGDKGRGTPSSQEYVKNYLVEFPSLRAIYAILRMALEIRGFYGGANKSIGTYGLTMMIVAALKLGDGTYPRHDLGKQLLHVLEVYADFDFGVRGIAVEPACFFHKSNSRKKQPRPSPVDAAVGDEKDYDPNQEAYYRGRKHISKMSVKENRKGDRICIQDPADYTNDLGRTCDTSWKIRHLFKAVLQDLRAGIEKCDEVHENHDTDSTADGNEKESEKPLLGFALGANYEDLELARDKVVYGSWFK